MSPQALASPTSFPASFTAHPPFYQPGFRTAPLSTVPDGDRHRRETCGRRMLPEDLLEQVRRPASRRILRPGLLTKLALIVAGRCPGARLNSLEKKGIW